MNLLLPSIGNKIDLARLRSAIRKPKRKAKTHNKEEVQQQLEELTGETLVADLYFTAYYVK